MRRIIGRTPGIFFLCAALCGYSLITLAVAQTPSESQPATQAAFDQQRLENLLGVLEGQNSPQARRTGARELLIQGWTEVTPRLVAILRGTNRPARIAVALALSDVPERLTNEYLDPLFEMLQDPEEESRKAATQALAAGANEVILGRLKVIAAARELPAVNRRAAIDALGMMTQREALTILFEILNDPNPEISDAALQTIEQMTAQDFLGDAQAATEWWEKVKPKSTAQWQRIQIERLIRQNRAREQRCRDLEQRLASTLRDAYFRTAEGQRPPLLSSFLTDTSVAVRKLGLTLVQAMLAEGKTLSNDTVMQTRELLNASEPDVRAAAVQTVATLRDSADAELFLNFLKKEHNRVVRRALINGLGYVGTTNSIAVLLDALKSTDPAIISEAVTALGRLIERGALDVPAKKQVADALYARYGETPHDDAVLRERLLWALSRLGDPQFAAAFIACLAPEEAGPLRIAAIRGITGLIDPRVGKTNGNGASATQPNEQPASFTQSLLDALTPLVGDANVEVRRACVDTLAQYAVGPAQLEALWTRLDREKETEDAIRQTAWRGAVRILATHPSADINAWLERLPGDAATRQNCTIEVLQAAVKSHNGEAPANAELGPLHARLAAEYAATNQIELAVSSYLSAIDNYAVSNPAETSRLAVELLRLAIRTGRYDGQLAAALSDGNSALDGALLWQGIRGEIEQHMKPDEIDQTIATLSALTAHPPTTMPADAQAAIETLMQRARQIQQQADDSQILDLLRQMREQPENASPTAAIINLGDRAVPFVRNALRDALRAEQSDEAWITRLHDLLKTLQPDWAGFAPEATLEEKLGSLE